MHKKHISLLCFSFLFSSTQIFAQTDTLYFGDWLAVVMNKLDAKYYGFVTKKNDKYDVETFFLTGELHMEGVLSDNKIPFKKYREGKFTFYTNGKKTSEGIFSNGKREGVWLFYYRNSDQLRDKVTFVHDTANGPTVRYNQAGKMIREGFYKDGKKNGEWKIYYASSGKIKGKVEFADNEGHGNFYGYDSATGKLMLKGDVEAWKPRHVEYYREDKNITLDAELKEGKPDDWGDNESSAKQYKTPDIKSDSENMVLHNVKDTTDDFIEEGTTIGNVKTGAWKYYIPKTGKLKFTCNYANGFLDGEVIGYYPDGKIRRREVYAFGRMIKGTCYAETGREIEYFSTTEIAEPRKNLSNYFKRSIRYPERARKKFIAGKVEVRFVVNEDGHISDPYKVTGIGWGCDDEALRVVANMDDWRPGTLEGVPVKMYLTLPIIFKLPE